MNRLINLFFLFLSVAIECLAQPAYKASLPVVGKEGYYKIDLPYEMLGASLPGLVDIRIINNEGEETAWLLKPEEERNYSNEFTPFRTGISSGNSRTDVLIETGGKPLSSFIMRIKNADTDKTAVLLGSYDRKAWFTVKEHLRLNNINNPTHTEAFIKVNFPLSDYSFYKVIINDSLTSPLNIMGAGILKEESSCRQLQLDVPVKKRTMQTSEKSTNIKLTFPFRTQISRLAFYVSAPLYYERDIRLSPFYATGKLISDEGKPLIVDCNQYTDMLGILIDNKDDLALTIDSIKVYTPRYYLIAFLKEGETYSMTFGDERAVMPEYDLSFSNHLPDSIPTLLPVDIEKQKASEPEVSFWIPFLKTYGIWSIIVIVMIQILFIVRRLLKQKP